ncbi:hypothetical protein ABFS82_14G056900 [Erythranthe guttata]|uniref:DOMON domain-containing protein n=1 Tax=Erythranthe guttata TaxID=4155 RepID=A0A022RLK9_ERYGU|nr:PREDICTED: auxin-induced in root cultures protein 12-like [Erythranthe guttata]EYU40648.1 hypothetical protein MIMGU_mgv1a012324mg [Erythranthe guttata]|eukprot:XP_012833563.1 PREDICTED: auxin-induced in root cultures protein 12-like [Erythranthe guttata]
MASSSLLLLLLIAAVSLLVSPAISQTCKSQTFGQSNTTFANCVDLPTLGAFLHYTYDSSAAPNPTLTLAFVAPPASPDGWVGWALNPTAPVMAGAQALVAFREANGSAVVKTYNITSYNFIAESPILYQVLSRRAEFSGGVMTIFATLELPAGVVELNQVWQVGSSVRNGVPAVHAFGPENLSSTGTLRFGSTAAPPTGSTGNEAPAPTGSGVNAPPPPPTRESGNDTGGSSMIYGGGFRLYGTLVLLGLFFTL